MYEAIYFVIGYTFATFLIIIISMIQIFYRRRARYEEEIQLEKQEDDVQELLSVQELT